MNILDRLPFDLPFGKSQPPQENFFALNISTKKLTASVWTVDGKSLRILNTAEVDYIEEADLVEAANAALDSALLDLTPEPDKILFGVPDYWLQDDNLKEGYLKILRNLVKELDVKPMAYVSTTHALTHFLQKQTGVPATTILVEVDDPLKVSVIKGGKIVGIKQAARGEDLPVDVQKVLLSFTGIEVLPSKISLFGQGDLDKFKSELTTFAWMSELPFLHLPKVEVLEPGVGIKAVSLSGASEIDENVTLSEAPLSTVKRPTHLMDRNIGEVEEGFVGAGFVAGDIGERETSDMEDSGQARMTDDQTTDISLRQEAVRQYQETIGQTSPLHPALSKFQQLLAVPLAFLAERGIKVPEKFRIGGYSFGRNLLIPVVILLVLMLGYVFLLKAQVTLFVDPKILEKDAQVVADPKATNVDEASKVIPGKIVEVSESGSDKGSATGKKQVGDPSRGTVTVRNKSNSAKSFSQGTLLLGPNGLKFTLDSTTPSIASPSADTGAWGTATGINVTASQIGPDSNLASGTILTLANQASSDFDAKVETGLSGGTSKDVQVVTSDDQKRLLAQVSSSLRQKAQSDLQSKLSGDQKILSEGLDETITSTAYSKKSGDQASEFSLNLVAHYRGTSYSDNDLKTMVSKLVATNVPDGYELNLSDTETQADVSKLEKDGRLIFLAKFRAKLLPKLDISKIRDQIKGKSPSATANILQGIDNVIGSDIVLKPQLPGFLARLPFLSQNISIKVGTK